MKTRLALTHACLTLLFSPLAWADQTINITGEAASQLAAHLEAMGAERIPSFERTLLTVAPLRCVYTPRGFIWAQCFGQALTPAGGEKEIYSMVQSAYELFSSLVSFGLPAVDSHIGIDQTQVHVDRIECISSFNYDTSCSLSYAAHDSILDWNRVQQVKFSRDARPVDGHLLEIIIERNVHGKFDIFSHTVTAGFGFPVQEFTTEVARSVECENGFADELGTLTNVMCVRDQRHVGGARIAVLFDIDSEEGTYSARKVVQTPHGEPLLFDLGTGLELEVLQ